MVEYWKKSLSEELKRCYEKMYREFSLARQTVSCGDLSSQDASKAYTALYYDHPELFFLSYAPQLLQRKSMSLFGGLNVSCEIISNCIYSSRDLQQCQKVLADIVSKIKQETRGLPNDQKKIEFVAEYITRNTEYEIDYLMNQNAASALVYHKAQCSGISKAFLLLMNALNIETIIINGTAATQHGEGPQGPHAWNIVKIEGRYYHVDVTFMLGANHSKNQKIKKRCLFYDDELIAEDHQWDRATVPKCTDRSRAIDELSATAEAASAPNYATVEAANAPHYASYFELRQALTEKIRAREKEFVFFLDTPASSQQEKFKAIENAFSQVDNAIGAFGTRTLISSIRGDSLFKMSFTYS